jgi:hypothetical protein
MDRNSVVSASCGLHGSKLDLAPPNLPFNRRPRQYPVAAGRAGVVSARHAVVAARTIARRVYQRNVRWLTRAHQDQNSPSPDLCVSSGLNANGFFVTGWF